MFRNVTGAQEAVVHRQSDDSLSHENNQIKLIKDVQSDDIAQTYSTLKNQWFDQREQLIENLKNLEKHNAFPDEIQHVKNLIECFNELIENGEVTKNCQLLINERNRNIQPLPETYLLAKKPLGEKMIRLPRHISKTTIDVSNSLKKISSDIIHVQQSDENLQHQVISIAKVFGQKKSLNYYKCERKLMPFKFYLFCQTKLIQPYIFQSAVFFF
jgi:hypothetical protein